MSNNRRRLVIDDDSSTEDSDIGSPPPTAQSNAARRRAAMASLRPTLYDDDSLSDDDSLDARLRNLTISSLKPLEVAMDDWQASPPPQMQPAAQPTIHMDLVDSSDDESEKEEPRATPPLKVKRAPPKAAAYMEVLDSSNDESGIEADVSTDISIDETSLDDGQEQRSKDGTLEAPWAFHSAKDEYFFDVKGNPGHKWPAFALPGKLYRRLYDYQVVGVQWMGGLYSNKAGGVLGDDMGMVRVVLCAFLRKIEERGLYLTLSDASSLPRGKHSCPAPTSEVS